MFESIVNSRFLLQTSIILCLNKIDVFRNKIPRVFSIPYSPRPWVDVAPQVPLELYFPDYTEGPDAARAAEYIRRRFIGVNHAKLRVFA